MFTGIVEEIGQVVSVDNQNDLSKVSIKTDFDCGGMFCHSLIF